MISLLILAALTAPSAHSGVTFKVENVDMSTLPYVVAYSECFETAAVETKASAIIDRRQRYQQCQAMRSSIAAKFGAEKRSGGLQAKRNLERTFNVIEKAFGKAIDKDDPVQKSK